MGKYGESKTKFGEYSVYYEESTYVVESVHPIQYIIYKITGKYNFIS